MFRLLPRSKLDGAPGPEAYHKNTPNIDACAEIHFQMKISNLSASTNPKKVRFSSHSIFKLQLFKFYLQTSLFKFYLQTTFFKFYLQTALFKFYLQNCTLQILSQSPRFFLQIVQFQVIENLLRHSKIESKNFGSF